MRKAVQDDRWKDIFTVIDEKIVSSDIVGSRYASTVDVDFTRVIGGNLVKVLSWYDNEIGYTNAMVKHVIEMGKHI